MRSKGLMFLVLLTGVVALAVWSTRREPADAASTTAGAGQPVFPGLADKLNDVTSISIVSNAGNLTVTRDGERWLLSDKDSYPAKFDTVKQTLLGMGDLKLVEGKTERADLYSKLGVEDPEAQGSTSTLVTLQGGPGAALAALIVGKPGPGHDTLFVRRASDKQAWLARGKLAPDHSATGWMDRELLKLESQRVKDVTITHADGEHVTVAREKQEDPVWALAGVADGMQPRSPTIGRLLAAALESLSFDDVRSRAKGPLPEEQQVVAVFHTFDGLQLTVTSAVEDGKTWATFAVQATDDATDAVKQEVTTLAARVDPWVFELPEYRAGNLRKHMSDLVQPIPPPAPPAADTATTPPADEGEGEAEGDEDQLDVKPEPPATPAPAPEPVPTPPDAPAPPR